jgi:hypothetical protein
MKRETYGLARSVHTRLIRHAKSQGVDVGLILIRSPIPGGDMEASFLRTVSIILLEPEAHSVLTVPIIHLVLAGKLNRHDAK